MSNIKTYGVLFGLLIGIIVAGTIVFSNLFDDSKEISFTDDTPIISSDRLTVHEIIDSSLIFQTAHFETNKKSLVEFYLTPRDHIRITNNSGAQLLDEVRIELKLEFLELYELVSSPDNVVVIYPTFTSAAYSEPGFYTFFRGQCDESCITDLSFDTPTLGFTSSGMSTQLLHILGY